MTYKRTELKGQAPSKRKRSAKLQLLVAYVMGFLRFPAQKWSHGFVAKTYASYLKNSGHSVLTDRSFAQAQRRATASNNFLGIVGN